MIVELATLAVVVTSPPPTPPAVIQQQCTYSVQESHDTYRCYSEQEFIEKQASEREALNKANAEFYDNVFSAVKWSVKNWWVLLIGVLATVVILIAMTLVYEEVDKKRHPHRYYDNGFKKPKYW